MAGAVSVVRELDATGEQAELLLAELHRFIDNDRCPFSPRIRTFRYAPDPRRAGPRAPAALNHYEPPSALLLIRRGRSNRPPEGLPVSRLDSRVVKLEDRFVGESRAVARIVGILRRASDEELVWSLKDGRFARVAERLNDRELDRLWAELKRMQAST